jgi:hypothetical protein
MSWTIGVLGFDSRRGLGVFLFTTASRTALGPTQPAIQWVPDSLSLVVKRPGREANHSPPSSPEIKEWVELYLHSSNTPSWRGAQLKHRDNFTFTFCFTEIIEYIWNLAQVLLEMFRRIFSNPKEPPPLTENTSQTLATSNYLLKMSKSLKTVNLEHIRPKTRGSRPHASGILLPQHLILITNWIKWLPCLSIQEIPTQLELFKYKKKKYSPLQATIDYVTLCYVRQHEMFSGIFTRGFLLM